MAATLCFVLSTSAIIYKGIYKPSNLTLNCLVFHSSDGIKI